MNKKNKEDLLDYLSLSLVVSFFILHNIIIVLVGIVLAIYKINESKIVKNIATIYNKTINKNTNNVSIVNEQTANKKLDDESLLSLVEVIEESGIIPSINKIDNGNAA